MQPVNSRNTALFIAILAGFVTPFDLSAVTIALPSLAAEFPMDAIQMGWVSTAYLLASAVFLVPFGRIADIYGRKKVFAAGLSIFTAASFLMLFAPSALTVILLRILQGFGSAMIFGTAVAILTSTTPPEHRGPGIGDLHDCRVPGSLDRTVPGRDPDGPFWLEEHLCPECPPSGCSR